MAEEQAQTNKGNATISYAGYIDYVFSDLRDYRVVRMADANGVEREGVFVPFIQNGIRYNESGTMHQHLTAKPNTSGGGALFRLYPLITMEMHQRMVDEGVLHPDDTRWADCCALIKESAMGFRYKRYWKYKKKQQGG